MRSDAHHRRVSTPIYLAEPDMTVQLALAAVTTADDAGRTRTPGGRA